METTLGAINSVSSYDDYSLYDSSESNKTGAANGVAATSGAAAAEAAASGDTVNLSAEGLAKAAAMDEPVAADPSKFTGSALTTTFGDDIKIEYTSGKDIVWNGKALDLKGLDGINATKDNLAFQVSGSYINVYNTATNTGYQLNSDGSQAKNDDGTLKAITGSFDDTKSVLLLNNSGSSVAGGSAGDVIINRAQNASVSSGAGDDKVFNFASNASITSGADGAEVYTTGLNGGTIDLSAADGAYVNIAKGNMTGGSIKLSAGVNTVDAGNSTLKNVTVSDLAGGSTTLTAKALSGGAITTLGLADITVNGSVSGSAITTGDGDDSVVITGSMTNSKVNLGAGNDSVTVGGSVSKSDFDLGAGNNDLTIAKTAKNFTYTGGAAKDDVTIKGAVSNSTIDLGAGTNTFKAQNDKEVNQKLTNVSITAQGAAGTDVNTIIAGAYKGGTNNEISLGNGTNKVTLGGAVSALDYNGSSGVDELVIGGAVKNSDFDLKSGEDSFSAVKYTKKGVAVGQALSNVDITASGTGSTDIFAGAFSTGKARDNKITLGVGDNTVSLGAVKARDSAKLLIDGQASTSNEITVRGTAKYLKYEGAAGNDMVRIHGAVAESVFNMGEGENEFWATSPEKEGAPPPKKWNGQTITNVLITGAENSTTDVTAGAMKVTREGAGLKLGNGPNDIHLWSVAGTKDVKAVIENGSSGDSDYGQDITIMGSVNHAKITAGEGNNTMRTGWVNNSEINLAGSSSNVQGIVVNGTVFNSSITLGEGMDVLDIHGTVKDSTVDMGDGFNILNLYKGGSGVTYQGGADVDWVYTFGNIASSKIDLGAGDNVMNATKDYRGKVLTYDLTDVDITASGTGKNEVTAGAYKAAKKGGTMDLGGGANTVSLTSMAGSKDALVTIKNAASLTVTGAVKGAAVYGTDGDDVIEVNGAISDSDFHLGAGNDKLSAFTVDKKDNVIGKALTNVGITLTGGTNSLSFSSISSGGQSQDKIVQGDITLLNGK